MERQAMENLIDWKQNHKGKPLIIYGPRQVGKTYLVREFAKKFYDNIFEVNFEIDDNANKIFEDNLTIKQLLKRLSAYDVDNIIIPKRTLIFLDEVQKCPRAITALKSFAQDGNYDVIATGSMLGVTLNSVSSYPVGYVETIYLKPLSFKEFLWANKYKDSHIKDLEEYYKNEQMVPEGLHNVYNNLFLQYIVVGGMPEVVQTFIETNNIGLVVKKQQAIIDNYSKDIAKYSTSLVKERVRECYNSIPDQLAMDNKKFQYNLLKTGGKSSRYYSSIQWIEDAGLINKIYRLKTFDIPLRAYQDKSCFKLYFMDTGLLLAMYGGKNLQGKILAGEIGIFKGALFENVIAQILVCNGLIPYYYRRDDRLEIDFVVSLDDKIVPIEVKAGTNTKSKSLLNVIEKQNLEYGIKLSMNNVNCSNPKYKCFPLYLTMFIKD